MRLLMTLLLLTHFSLSAQTPAAHCQLAQKSDFAQPVHQQQIAGFMLKQPLSDDWFYDTPLEYLNVTYEGAFGHRPSDRQAALLMCTYLAQSSIKLVHDRCQAGLCGLPASTSLYHLKLNMAPDFGIAHAWITIDQQEHITLEALDD
ncbi:hypothetical protein [Algicola sagamiensis]|uniref:hypothetical protein n=1 Tax=Algicola sagamiensis TaxID=163869 RepID=UPI000374AEF1|nr:hypothetical protein [Algicola sagamiensis]